METANQFSKEFKDALKSLVTKPNPRFWMPAIHSRRTTYYHYNCNDRGAKTLSEAELTILLEAFKNPNTVANLASNLEVNQVVQTIQGYWLKGMLEELENARFYKANLRISEEAKQKRSEQQAAKKKAKKKANEANQKKHQEALKKQAEERKLAAEKRKEREKQREIKQQRAIERLAMEKLQAEQILANLKVDPKQKALLRKVMRA